VRAAGESGSTVTSKQVAAVLRAGGRTGLGVHRSYPMGIVGEGWALTEEGRSPIGDAPSGVLRRIWSCRRWNIVIDASSVGFGDWGVGRTVCHT
jgi:hypothetical protein